MILPLQDAISRSTLLLYARAWNTSHQGDEMRNLQLEERLANYVKSLSEYEFGNLLTRMYDYRNEIPDGVPDWYHERESRKEVLAKLLNAFRTSDGYAFLLPLTNARKVGLSFSEWLEASRNRGFRKGLPFDSVKRIFSERVKALVEEGFVVRTIGGYAPAPGIQILLSGAQELRDLWVRELD